MVAGNFGVRWFPSIRFLLINARRVSIVSRCLDVLLSYELIVCERPYSVDPRKYDYSGIYAVLLAKTTNFGLLSCNSSCFIGFSNIDSSFSKPYYSRLALFGRRIVGSRSEHTGLSMGIGRSTLPVLELEAVSIRPFSC